MRAVSSFMVGQRVRVRETHWNPRVHGAIGAIYSSSTTPEGERTHNVTLVRRAAVGPDYTSGEWILESDLERVGNYGGAQ